MVVNSISFFLEKLQRYLAQVEVSPDSEDNMKTAYLDLAECYKLLEDDLSRSEKLPFEPLSEAFALIVNGLNRNSLDNTKIGINELLKFYLRKIQKANQEKCTHLFLIRINCVFVYSLLPSFPFTDMLWQYICKCIQPVGFYLLEKQLTEACLIFSDYIAIMGKIAAREGLPTDKLQHYLRMTETKALEIGLDQLAGHVKNHRHNLEL
ncbi:MAG: hypothetical protein APF76_12365 [Desulfitibacter sp. BRH_c19]|nr:MAG: hypothetical protein APF76_12365 [Desulfitibacter sp. BRH_c19]